MHMKLSSKLCRNAFSSSSSSCGCLWTCFGFPSGANQGLPRRSFSSLSSIIVYLSFCTLIHFFLVLLYFAFSPCLVEFLSLNLRGDFYWFVFSVMRRYRTRVSEWVTLLNRLDWCDPGEWRYLLKILLMRLWRLMILLEMMLEVVIGVLVMEVDKVADEVTDMEVDKVADMKIPIWLKWFWRLVIEKRYL